MGPVWKPKIAEGWAPFQKGRWRWYDARGHTWVSDEALGLAAVPLRPLDADKNDLGWVWVPAATPGFKPGDVYWLRGRSLRDGVRWRRGSSGRHFTAAVS